MKLHNLSPAAGSTHNSKRIGRGQGTGKGGTSTKGHKGAKSRSGHSDKIGFEGGQMPLQRRLPKFGFTNINRIEYRAINLDTLQNLIATQNIEGDITPEVLREYRLASKKDLIKVLGRGELSNGVTIKAHKFTKSAEEAINKAGGTAELI